MDASSCSEATPPTPSDAGIQGQLSSTPQSLNVIVDLPESSESTSSQSLLPADSSSPDSASFCNSCINLSSAASQQEPIMTSSAAEPIESELTSSTVNAQTSGFKLVIDDIDKTETTKSKN